jgi:hypothetical protein
LEEIKRREEEAMLERQQRTVTKKSMTASVSNMPPTGGSNAQKIAGSFKTEEEESCEQQTADFKKSPLFRRSKESPKNSRTTATRTSSSPRCDAVEARNRNANLNCKQRRGLPSDDGNDDEGCEDNPALHKTIKRRKISSPFSKRANPLCFSPARLKKNYGIGQESIMKDENDDISSAESNSAASPYSVASQRSPAVSRSQRRRPNAHEKVSSSSQSTTVSRGEPKPMNTTTATENERQSDSDGSFNMMSAFKQRQKSKNQASKQERTKSQRSDDPPSCRMRNSRRGDDSLSCSEDDYNEEDLKDGNENSRRRKSNKNEKIPHKRHAAAAADDDDNGEDSEGSGQKNRKSTRKPSSFGKKKTVHRDYSSSESFGDEESVLETDDDETRSSIRYQKSEKPRNPIALEHDASDQFFLSATGSGTNNKSAAPTSFVDGGDDGFMSDCDPLSATSTDRSVKEDTTSRRRKEHVSPGGKDKPLRKKRRRRASSEESNKRLPSFDNDDGQYEEDCGGTLEDLHPNFKNPKFGPYEPMEPLLLPTDQNETLLQVPASLNRFLAPFQKEGVRFMYKCLSRRSGVILGDEMVSLYFYQIVFAISLEPLILLLSKPLTAGNKGLW